MLTILGKSLASNKLRRGKSRLALDRRKSLHYRPFSRVLGRRITACFPIDLSLSWCCPHQFARDCLACPHQPRRSGAGYDRVATAANARLRSAGNLFLYGFIDAASFDVVSFDVVSFDVVSFHVVSFHGLCGGVSFHVGSLGGVACFGAIRCCAAGRDCIGVERCGWRFVSVFIKRSGSAHAPYGSPDPATAAQSFDANAYVERSLAGDEGCWSWQILPNGLMYKSYLAGDREPRFGTQFVHERNQGWLWDSTLGGRVGLFRYGTDNDFWPQGWQLDIEGAAFPRLELDKTGTWFRSISARRPLTTRQGPWEMKFGYYHLLLSYRRRVSARQSRLSPDQLRARDADLGWRCISIPSLRLYWETGWAFQVEGAPSRGSSSSAPISARTSRPAPRRAVLRHQRPPAPGEQFQRQHDRADRLAVRGRTGHLFRMGMQYFNGMSDQAQFYNTFEEQIGVGLWYDF